MARFVHGWAWPKTPNAQHNLGLLGMFRMPLQMPPTGRFDPQYRGVLAEGLSIEEMTALCARHDVPIIPTTLVHDPGDSTGTGYHGAHGWGRAPYLDPGAAQRFAREQRDYFAKFGVPVWAPAFGNELGYSPRSVGDWPQYMDAVFAAARAFWNGWGQRRIILGGNSGRRLENGRTSIAFETYTRRLAERYMVDIHANNNTIQQVVSEIRWGNDWGLTMVVLEDRKDGPTNDAAARGRAFARAGAVAVGQFGSRDVSALGNNPGCRWGVRTNKPTRRTGAAWTCAGHLPHNYNQLVLLATYLGDRRPGEVLPDDTETGPPPIPAYAEPLANMLRRTFALAGNYPRPVVGDMLDDADWLRAARHFVEGL